MSREDVQSQVYALKSDVSAVQVAASDLSEAIAMVINGASQLSDAAKTERDTAVAAVVALQERVRVLESANSELSIYIGLVESLQSQLGAANNEVEEAYTRIMQLEEIERKAIEQSETVQRDWASPVEVAGMKKRIEELEQAARFVIHAWKPQSGHYNPHEMGSALENLSKVSEIKNA